MCFVRVLPSSNKFFVFQVGKKEIIRNMALDTKRVGVIVHFSSFQGKKPWVYLINAVILNKTGGLLLTISLDINTFFVWLFVLMSESNDGLKML